MANESRLAEMLLDWESARVEGRVRAPEDLCRDCPELLEPLRERIQVLARLGTVLDLTGYGKEENAETRRDPDPGKSSSDEFWDKIKKRSGERPMPSPPGFEIQRELGRGGMGMVYLARQTALDRLVAVKMLLGGARARPKDLARFEIEARAVARLHHPHIVQIYDVGTVEDCPFLVLEYMEGGDLDGALAGRTLSPARAASLLEVLARAVHHAHQSGVIHRDLKPGNVLLTYRKQSADGEVELGDAKITDFGLARRLGQKNNLTGTGAILGTPAYMAPEQAAGRNERVGPGTDIYALGAILYQVLTGVPPLEGESDWETTRKVLEDPPVPPSRHRPEIPAELDSICLRCLRKEPADRYLGADQLADDLRRFLAGQPVPPMPPESKPILPPPPKSWSRRLWLAGAGGTVAAAAGYWIAQRWLDRPLGQPIKLGLLHSMTGTMSLSERPLVYTERLAIDELNEAGGLLGRPVASVVADGQSQEDGFARAADQLIDQEKVVALVGCWTSASRKAVVEVVERHDNLLLYPVEFEGLESSQHVVYLGSAANQQVVPALAWMREKMGKKRFFLFGSDYIFPRASAAFIKAELQRSGLALAGEAYLPLGGVDVSPLLHQMVDARPDAILNFINGDSNVTLFRRMREVGIKPAEVPTMSFSLSEQEVTSIGIELMKGDYLVSGYFQSLPNEANKRFLGKLRATVVGERRVASDAMATAYVAVHLWAQAVKAAGTTEAHAVRQAMLEQTLEGPAGKVKIDAASGYAYRYARVGRIKADGAIEVVHESANLIRPEVYPSTGTHEEWDNFLREWYDRWGGRWSAPNVE